MDGKRTRCLQIVSQHVPIYLQQFPSYSNRKCKKSPFSRTAAHILVSPGDAPAIQCLPYPSQHVPIYIQYFPSYMMLKSMRKSKNRYFYHIFVFPGDALGAITLNVVWMESQFSACQTYRSMYPSIFNSFPVIRTASANNRRFYVPQPTFLFPLGTPWGNHAKCYMDGKRIRCLQIVSLHVPI